MTKRTRERLIDWAVWLAVAVLAAGVAFGGYHLIRQGERVDAMSAALTAEQDAARSRGETPVAPDPSALIDDPQYQGPKGDPGPAPTDAQVLAAVASYFEEFPVKDGESPSAAEVAAAVANWLTENPPADGEPGPAPSAEQLAAAVETYLTQFPPADGPQGPGPTAEQIADAIEAYLLEFPIELCPDGFQSQAHELLTTSGATIEAAVCVAMKPE